MNALRRGTTLALAAAGLLAAAGAAHARGETGDESALAVLESRAAPLALSANGQWRVHVDAQNVLYRVNMLDAKQVQKRQLPVAALQLAASRTAQKVAFTSPLGCVGLVDFGNPPLPTPQLNWISNAPATPDGKLRILGDKMPSPQNCKALGQRSVVALSTDGQLVANATHVYDLEHQTVLASLPSSLDDIGRRRTLAIQFTDNNTKLFLATATLGAGYESPDSPSDMQFSVWDLQRKSLLNLAGGARRTQFVPEMLLFSYAPQTGALRFVQSDRYFQAREQSPNTAEKQALLDLVQTNLHTCQSRPATRLALTPWQWLGYVVDPWGRWIAGVRKFAAASTGVAGAGRGGRHFVEELVVLDLRSGQQLDAIPLVQPLHGLVAAPDGSAILGLTPPPGGDVVHINVHPSALALPKDERVSLGATPCRLENEVPGARNVESTTRLLQPLWTLPVQALGDLQAVRDAERVRMRSGGSGTAEPLVCRTLGLYGQSFTMADQTLWLDNYADMAQLDWRTGRVLKTLPTPRTRNVCSTPMPQAGGFINYQGDTLSFQSFDSLLEGATQKQTVEVKRGWSVYDVSWPDGAGQVPRSFQVAWRTKPDSAPPKGAQGEVLDMLVATYDSSSRRRIREVGTATDSYEMGLGGAGGADDADGASGPPVCATEPGSGKRLVRFAPSYFDSFRAYQCDDGNAAETVWWVGLDIAPKQSTTGPMEERSAGRVLALGRSIGVVDDGRGQFRVYDISARKELAQLQAPAGSVVQGARLSEAQATVVLELLDPGADRTQRSLHAYRYR